MYILLIYACLLNLCITSITPSCSTLPPHKLYQFELRMHYTYSIPSRIALKYNSELTTPSSLFLWTNRILSSILMLMKILQPQTKIQTEVVDTCLMFSSIIQQLPSRRAIKIPNNPKSYWPNKRIICRKTNRTY